MSARPADPHLGLIVEGPGDVQAVPILLRAIHANYGCNLDCFGKPVAINGRSNADRVHGLEGFSSLVGGRPGCYGVLVVLDADDNERDVAHYRKSMRERAQSSTATTCAVVIAVRDFEQWIYCSAETLRLPGLVYRSNARGLKAIQKALRPDKYVKPVMQPKLTARMDLNLAMPRSASLRSLAKTVQDLHDLLPKQN